MSDDPKKLARREADALRKVQKSTPLAFVVAPISRILGSIQALAGNEMDEMLKEQADGVRLDLEGAKKLNVLTMAVVAAHRADKELSAEEAGDLSDEELEAEYVKALEANRAKESE